ncbi:MAG: 4-hydroxythreonine-4-phosphate dehydrogenase PdxA [Elusimicrobiota bacterium]
MKKIYITMGDPRGVGPEIIFKGLADIFSSGSMGNNVPIVIGNSSLMQKYADICGTQISPAADIDHGKNKTVYFIHRDTTGHPGADSIDYIDTAVRLCRAESGNSIVTAPVTKESIAEVRPGFTGHTEYIAGLAGVETVVMVFVSSGIKMSLMTTHLPLRSVVSVLNSGYIIQHVNIVCDALKSWYGFTQPRIAICSVNPHSGEKGIMGNEESELLELPLKTLRDKGVDITGPLGAYEALKRTVEGEYDFLISIYHDQVLSGAKVFLGPLVNVTAGLPFIRTSPDHGPAIDISGKDMADYRSMKAALELAARISENTG